MSNSKKNAKGYNEKNPVQPQGSIIPDKKEEKQISPEGSSPNENMSIPERKLKKQENNDNPANRA